MSEIQQEEFYAPERILVIVAHSDDIEFGIGGSIARWVEGGSQVTYCLITDSAAGSNEVGADLKALVVTRREEQIAAAYAVGVTDVRFLEGHPDGTLQPTLALRRDLTRVIRQVRPQLVVAMDPTTVFLEDVGYINHPDHRAAGEAALYAIFPSAGARPIFPELLDEGLEPHNVDRVYFTLTAKPTLYIDVTGTYPRKVAALECHKSQIGTDMIEVLRGWDADSGAEIGVKYAETFRVLRLDLLP